MKKRGTTLLAVAIVFLMAFLLVVAAFAASGSERIHQILGVGVILVSVPFAILVMVVERAEEKAAERRSRKAAINAYRYSHNAKVKRNAALAPSRYDRTAEFSQVRR